jgi:cysteine desulfurase / selenocysteine lyase
MIQSISSRLDYPCLKTQSYFNQASLGLMGEPAVSAMHRFLDETARHGNLKMSDSEEAVFLQPLRSRFARLIDAQENNVAIVGSASEILSQLPALLSPPEGSKIILVATDFPAITRPWIAFCEVNPCTLCFVEEEPDQSLTNEIIQNLNAQTAAVCVSFVQFSSGRRLDISRLRAATLAVGAKLVVDVTQAAGAVPVCVQEWDADVVVCSGYKWLGGHGGIAFASFSDALLEKQPPFIGWFGGRDPFDMDAKQLLLSKTAARYTQSTLSYISVVGLNAALDELLKLSVERIHNHSIKLGEVLLTGLNNLEWEAFVEAESDEFSPHIMTLQTAHYNVQSALQKLTKNGVICGIRNGRIRVSLAHYNNEDDIQALLKAL